MSIVGFRFIRRCKWVHTRTFMQHNLKFPGLYPGKGLDGFPQRVGISTVKERPLPATKRWSFHPTHPRFQIRDFHRPSRPTRVVHRRIAFPRQDQRLHLWLCPGNPADEASTEDPPHPTSSIRIQLHSS
jgi:hypothetical protein